MPNVPVYSTPQAAPTNLPDARQQTPYRMMQSAQIGPQEQQRLGQSLTSAGTEVMNMATMEQIQQNEIAAKNHDTAQVTSNDAILHGSDDGQIPGYLNLKGQAAVDAFDDTVRKLKQVPTDLSQGLNNNAQQQLVQNTSQLRLDAALAQAKQHRAQQMQVADVSASQTRIKVGSMSATKSFDPSADTPTLNFNQDDPASNSAYQQGLQTVASEARALSVTAGDKADVTESKVKMALGDTYFSTLKYMFDKKTATPADTKLAQGYFDKVKDSLSPEQVEYAKGVLEASGNKDASLNLFYEASKLAGNIAAQTDYIDDQYKAGKISSEVRDLTVTRLEHANAQRRSEQSENDKSVIGTVWDMARNGKSMADISPPMMNYIKTRGLGEHIDNIFKRNAPGGDALDDSALYNDQMRMSAEDPSSFVKQDLALLSGKLSQAHWNHLVGMQTSINRSDIKAQDQNKLVHNAILDTKASLLSAGFNLNPKPGTPQATELDKFESDLRDTLVSAQQDWIDKKLTPAQQREEARKITAGALKDQALAGTGYFGTSIGRTHMPVYKMTPEQRAAPWVIPDADRAQIKASLQKQGLPASEDLIQRAYKINQGVH